MCVRHPSQVENISLLFNLFKRNSAIFHSGCKNSVILHDQASAVIQHGVSPVFHGLIRRFYNSPNLQSMPSECGVCVFFGIWLVKPNSFLEFQLPLFNAEKEASPLLPIPPFINRTTKLMLKK